MTTDPLYQYFATVAGSDEKIDAPELQQCLTNSGIAGSYQSFSLETCKLMITMLDSDHSGKMEFDEFKELWGVLNQWQGTFLEYDRDRNNSIESHELHQAITTLGYNLSPQAIGIIVKRYADNNKIKFDDFVALTIRLRILTDHFHKIDTGHTGYANFSYDDFIQLTICS